MRKEFFDKIEKGKLTISKVNTNGRPNYVLIQIEDGRSTLSFLEIEISFENFAKCITGSAAQDVDFGVKGLDKIGKKLETKTEQVLLPDFCSSDEEIDACVSCFEIDGWIGRRTCCKNHHNHTGGGLYNVTFHRWVDIKENEDNAKQL